MWGGYQRDGYSDLSGESTVEVLCIENACASWRVGDACLLFRGRAREAAAGLGRRAEVTRVRACDTAWAGEGVMKPE
eukprot:6198059-Pleurochrysis_carterae.AAC.9